TGTDGRPRLLKWYLQSCGSAFIKLGQLMAMRYDLFPEEYCNELSKLLDEIPPDPTSRIIPIIEKDLGAPISANFADFNPVPLGTASIAQVHEAKLITGEEIVIKVLRPGNRIKFQVDLAYLKLMGRVIGQLGLLKNIDVRLLIRELIKLTWEEFDFRREARNIQQMHELMCGDEVDHYAPKIYLTLCATSVITMEKIKGVSVKAMIAAIEKNDTVQLNEWAGQGITPQRTARILIRSVLEQCMRHRLFHADPHAANLIVMKNGTLGWIDFGMLGWLDELLLALQFKLRVAIQEERIHEAYSLLLETLEPMPPIDLSVFESEVKEYIRDWIVASRNPQALVVEKSSGYFFLRLFVAIRRAGLSMPPGLTRMYRAIIISDIVMLKLSPKIDWLPVLGEFLREEHMRQAKILIKETFTPSNLSSVLQFYSNLPRTSVAVADWARNGLKEYGRSYRQQLSRLERISLLLLQYLRTFIFLFLLLTIAVKFFNLKWTESLKNFDIFITGNWALITVIGILIILFLNKVIYEFKRSDY
ncbi:MAG: AarF/UbiB family protein, partial [Chitinophagaceae bacterium]